MNPLVSIIITNFNKEKYLEQCLKSCLNQTYKNFEICVADNNSTDRSIEIINKYSKKITVWFKVPNWRRYKRKDVIIILRLIFANNYGKSVFIVIFFHVFLSVSLISFFNNKTNISSCAAPPF